MTIKADLARVLSNRKTPATRDSLASRLNASPKTISNYLTEYAKLASWVPTNCVVGCFSDGNKRGYMLLSSKEAKKTIAIGNRSYSLSDNSEFIARYERS